MVLATIAALSVLLSQYFFAINQLGWLDSLDKVYNMMAALAIGLGLVNLTVVHSGYIRRKREHWWASVVLLVCLWGYTVLSLVLGNDHAFVDWFYQHLIVPADSTLYGMVSFFITVAAYRVFRVRTLEATILLASAVFVLLGTAPIGDVIVPGWSTARQWILDVPNTGGMRGIIIGTYLGAWATALRVMLGLERAHLGGAG